jgi:hypothetical protein
MDLEHALNKIAVEGHQGPHGFYNLAVFDRLRSAVSGLTPNTAAYRTALQGELLRLRVDVLRSGTGGLHELLTSPASTGERMLAKLIALGKI